MTGLPPQFAALIEANRAYAASFDAGALPRSPARELAVLTCMDARMDPLRILGLRASDVAVLRNAGGRATADAIASLVVAHALLGVRDVLVVHHTECGMAAPSTEELRGRIEAAIGAPAPVPLPSFSDLDAGVTEDVRAIRDSPPLRRLRHIAGMVYDVRTGLLREVAV